jgi:predicted NAD/FAD-binding protein
MRNRRPADGRKAVVTRQTVAVIGSGIAGLTAAYLLERSFTVSLYEADDRLGGHAHTHHIAAAGQSLSIDSGFIVHNERTYPTLLRLFRELGITTQDCEMSMSVRCEECGLEYAGARGAAGLFAGPGSFLRGRYLRMLTEIPAFHAAARGRCLARDGARGPPPTMINPPPNDPHPHADAPEANPPPGRPDPCG